MSLGDILEAGFARTEAAENNTEGQTSGAALETPTSGNTGGQPAETAGEFSPTDGTGGTPTMMNESAETSDVPAQTPAAASATETAPAAPVSPELAALRDQNAQLMAMVRELHGELAQQRQAVQQQSQLAEEAVGEAAEMTPPPMLDFAALQYASPEEQQAALAEYHRAVQESTLGAVRKEMQPVITAHEQAARAAEVQTAREMVYNRPEFSDFREHDAEIEKILSVTPELNSLPAAKARMFAGLINRGMRHDPNHQMSADELVQAVMANPDAMKALEMRRAQNVQEKNANLPRISASQGMSNAAPVPEHKPQTKRDLWSAIDKHF